MRIVLSVLSLSLLIDRMTIISFQHYSAIRFTKVRSPTSTVIESLKVHSYQYRRNVPLFATFPPREDASNVSSNRTIITISENESKKNWIARVAAFSALIGVAYYFGQNIDFNSLIERSLSKITDMGPYGYLYFSFVSCCYDISIYFKPIL